MTRKQELQESIQIKTSVLIRRLEDLANVFQARAEALNNALEMFEYEGWWEGNGVDLLADEMYASGIINDYEDTCLLREIKRARMIYKSLDRKTREYLEMTDDEAPAESVG